MSLIVLKRAAGTIYVIVLIASGALSALYHWQIGQSFLLALKVYVYLTLITGTVLFLLGKQIQLWLVPLLSAIGVQAYCVVLEPVPGLSKGLIFAALVGPAFVANCLLTRGPARLSSVESESCQGVLFPASGAIVGWSLANFACSSSGFAAIGICLVGVGFAVRGALTRVRVQPGECAFLVILAAAIFVSLWLPVWSHYGIGSIHSHYILHIQDHIH